MTNKVTIKDVARRAGVSMSTVSQILNGKEQRFSSDTRRRVLQARDELGYVPDFNARNLIMNSVKSIGVIVPDISNPFFSTFIKSIEQLAMEQNYIPLILSSDGNQELERSYLEQLINRSIDGIIIASPSVGQEEIDTLLKKNRIPYLLIDQNPVSDGDRVMTDDFHGAGLAVNHLARLGHRRIAMIMAARPSDNLRRRLSGYIEALRENGIEFDKNLVIKTEMSKIGGLNAARKLVRTDATAVLTVNDEVAVGLYRGLQSLGKRIPDDYSIVGYDNIDLDEYLTPPLTSISQPIHELGATAFRQLTARISNPDLPNREVILPVKLVRRGSTRKV